MSLTHQHPSRALWSVEVPSQLAAVPVPLEPRLSRMDPLMLIWESGMYIKKIEAEEDVREGRESVWTLREVGILLRPRNG